LCFRVVMLMNGDLTCCSYVDACGFNFKDVIFCPGFVNTWEQQFISSLTFLGFVNACYLVLLYVLWLFWCVGATTHKLHDLYGHVDVWSVGETTNFIFCFSCGYVNVWSFLLLPQVNGWACVDFGCTHPIDGLFWSLPVYLLGFFSK